MSRRVKTKSSANLPMLAGLSFAERLNGALEGTTSSEFARLVGRDLRTVQRWRSGDSEPRGADLISIAGALGVDPRAFYPERCDRRAA